MAKILGSSKEEILGKNIYIFLDDESEEILHDSFKKNKKGKKISQEITFIRESGEKIPCLMHSTPVIEDNSNTSEIFAMVTDISEMKYFQKELVKAMKQAGEATRAKSSFLANMSHEIRTPMNAIIGLSSLALKTNLDFKQRDYIEKVNNAGVSLLGIINDILDFSKIESGKFEIEKSDFNIDKVLDNVFSVVLYKVAEKNLDLNILLPKELPLGLVGDPLRLGQILINLVNNAVKFTEKGHIEIKLEIINATVQTIKIRFSVVDTGIGISKEGLSKLFKPFSQTDSSISRKFGGTGLGLSISKNLVDLMNGKIWAESDFGVGSRFIFEIEFPISSKIKNDSESSNEFRRLNILVLEKNKEFYDIISNYLQYLPVN
ncbi:MAG: PAS domain-containing hybrid sensor histidine kinase/response regulator, partial [Spirochaetia bacterium]|nr:PAS domain-containing hybrid sensor histidine kinase/response regulator [Spirochaetia bacterium]